MATAEPPTTHLSRPLAIAGLLLATVTLVAVASHGTPLQALIHRGRVSRLEALVGVVVLCGVVGSLATVATVVFHRMRYGGASDGRPLRITLLRSLPITAAVMTTLSLIVIAETDQAPLEPVPAHRGQVVQRPGRSARPSNLEWWGGLAVAGDSESTGKAGGNEPQSSSTLPFLLLLAASLLAAGAVVYGWHHEKRERSPESDDEPLVDQEAVHDALSAIIDAMLADPDPNTAIRGAYARLLEMLDALGTGRRAQEGPMEHLRRTLRLLDVREAPLRELVRLFSLARFSIRPLTATHRDQALGALRAVADDLAGGPRVSNPAGGAAHRRSDP